MIQPAKFICSALVQALPLLVPNTFEDGKRQHGPSGNLRKKFWWLKRDKINLKLLNLCCHLHLLEDSRDYSRVKEKKALNL